MLVLHAVILAKKVSTVSNKLNIFKCIRKKFA